MRNKTKDTARKEEYHKRFRHSQRTSVKGFVPYLVKLPVPLVPLLKVSVFPLHLLKFNK